MTEKLDKLHKLYDTLTQMARTVLDDFLVLLMIIFFFKHQNKIKAIMKFKQ